MDFETRRIDRTPVLEKQVTVASTEQAGDVHLSGIPGTQPLQPHVALGRSAAMHFPPVQPGFEQFIPEKVPEMYAHGPSEPGQAARIVDVISSGQNHPLQRTPSREVLQAWEEGKAKLPSVSGAGAALASGAQQAADSAAQGAEALRETAADLGQGTQSLPGVSLNIISEVVAAAGEVFATGVHNLEEAVLEAIPVVKANVEGFIGTAVPFVKLSAHKAAEAAQPVVQSVGAGLQSAGTAVAQGAAVAAPKIQAGVNSAGAALAQGATAAAQGATVAGQKIADTASAAGGAVVQGASVAGQKIATGATVAGQTIASGAVTAKDTVVQGSKAAVDTVGTGVQQAGATVATAASSAATGVGQVVQSIGETVVAAEEAVLEAGRQVAHKIVEIEEAALDAGKQAVQTIVAAEQAAVQKGREVVQTIVEAEQAAVLKGKQLVGAAEVKAELGAADAAAAVASASPAVLPAPETDNPYVPLLERISETAPQVPIKPVAVVKDSATAATATVMHAAEVVVEKGKEVLPSLQLAGTSAPVSNSEFAPLVERIVAVSEPAAGSSPAISRPFDVKASSAAEKTVITEKMTKTKVMIPSDRVQ